MAPFDPDKFAKCLTVTSRDARWGIYCTTVGCTKMSSARRYPPDPSVHPVKYLFKWEMGRIYDEYALVYITRGAGTFKSDGDRTWPVTAGCLFMLFPDVWHWYVPDRETGWDEYWVGFKGDYPRMLVEDGFFSPGTPMFNIGLHDSILELYLQMFDCARTEAPGYQQVLGSLISHLLANIISLTQEHGADSANERLVQRAKFLLAEQRGDPPGHRLALPEPRPGLFAFPPGLQEVHGPLALPVLPGLEDQPGKGAAPAGAVLGEGDRLHAVFRRSLLFLAPFQEKTGHPPSEWH